MPRPAQWHDWFVLLALTVFWGTAFYFTELALRAFSPALLVALRIGMAAFVLLTLLRLQGKRLPGLGRDWIPVLVIAVLGTVLPFNLVAWAQQYIDSGLTAILMAMMPLFVLLLSHFFVPGERLTGLRVVGFIVGFIGVYHVMGPDLGSLRGISKETWGMLAVLVATLSYASGSVYTRRCGHGNPLPLAAGMLLVASLLTAPMAVTGAAPGAWPPGALALTAVAMLGVICTAFSTVLFFRLVQGPGPTFLSLVNYMVPAWAVLVGALILGETLEKTALFGLGLILSGIAISEGGPRLVACLHSRRSRRVRSLPAIAAEET